jgi:hypothetical protein
MRKKSLFPGFIGPEAPPPPAPAYGLPSASQLPTMPDPNVPAPLKGPSIMDILLPGGEGLSRRDRKAGQLSGAIAGGLSLLAAAGPHSAREIQPNLGQGLLGALVTGREAARANFDASYTQQEQEQMQRDAEENAAMFRGLGIGPNDTDESIRKKLQQGFMFAVQQGNAKAATSISEVLKSMGDPKGASGGQQWHSVPLGNNRHEILNNAGETIRIIEGSPDKSSGGQPPKPEVYEIPDGKGGTRRIMGYWDAANQRVVEVPGLVPPPEKAKTEAQGKAQAFISFTDKAVERIESALGGATGADKTLAALGSQSLFSNIVRSGSENATSLANNAGILAEAWLRMTTGAAYNKDELANAKAIFTILPTDTPEIARQKTENMYMLRNMLKVISGNPELQEQYMQDGRRETPLIPGAEKLGEGLGAGPAGNAGAVDALIEGGGRATQISAPTGLQMKPYVDPFFRGAAHTPKVRPATHANGR